MDTCYKTYFDYRKNRVLLYTIFFTLTYFPGIFRVTVTDTKSFKTLISKVDGKAPAFYSYCAVYLGDIAYFFGTVGFIYILFRIVQI